MRHVDEALQSNPVLVCYLSNQHYHPNKYSYKRFKYSPGSTSGNDASKDNRRYTGSSSRFFIELLSKRSLLQSCSTDGNLHNKWHAIFPYLQRLRTHLLWDWEYYGLISGIWTTHPVSISADFGILWVLNSRLVCNDFPLSLRSMVNMRHVFEVLQRNPVFVHYLSNQHFYPNKYSYKRFNYSPLSTSRTNTSKNKKRYIRQ